MLSLKLLAGAVGAFSGALLWFKVIVPFSRVVKLSEDLVDRQWLPGASAIQAESARSHPIHEHQALVDTVSMTNSLVNLRNSLALASQVDSSALSASKLVVVRCSGEPEGG
jgi:hypothetical protein